MLTNPMVLMMVVPLILLVILPKLINANDPEVKKVNHLLNSSPFSLFRKYISLTAVFLMKVLWMRFSSDVHTKVQSGKKLFIFYYLLTHLCFLQQ